MHTPWYVVSGPRDDVPRFGIKVRLCGPPHRHPHALSCGHSHGPCAGQDDVVQPVHTCLFPSLHTCLSRVHTCLCLAVPALVPESWARRGRGPGTFLFLAGTSRFVAGTFSFFGWDLFIFGWDLYIFGWEPRSSSSLVPRSSILIRSHMHPFPCHRRQHHLQEHHQQHPRRRQHHHHHHHHHRHHHPQPFRFLTRRLLFSPPAP